MNQEIKPFTAIVLLAIFGGLLWGKFWAHHAAISVHAVSYMHKHPDGTAYLMVDNQLLGFDDKANFTQRIELSRFGLAADTDMSDFAFFSNGDLLIRRHVPPDDFIYGLQRYFRFKNLRDETSANPEDGLYRCNTGTFECKPFTNPPLNLTDVFGLAIDWRTDRVFLSDTTRHVLRMFSSTGEALDLKEGFLFPNCIQYQDGKLFVADTNHHRLAVVGVEEERLGNVLESMDTRAGPAVAKGEVWPSDVLLAGNRRWVRNANNDMLYGGVYVFENDGEFVKRLELPEGADPSALLELNGAVLVSDFNRERIYQFTRDGDALPDFMPEALRPHFEKLSPKRSKYQWLERGFTLLFALGLVGGFGYAIFQQRARNQDTVDVAPAQEIPSRLSDLDIRWIGPALRFRLMIWVMGLLPPVLMGVLLFVYYLENTPLADFATQSYGLALLCLLVSFSAFIQLRRKIGVTDTLFILVPSLGKPSICFKEQIVYSDLAIVAGNGVMAIDKLSVFFSPDDVELLIYPAIKTGRYVDAMEMQSLLLKRNLILAGMIGFIVLLVGAFVYIGMK